MNSNAVIFERSDDDDIFTCEACDEALEAAANTASRPALSFPAAPTVSVLVVCCGNDDRTVRARRSGGW
jgi:hypothetical protein